MFISIAVQSDFTITVPTEHLHINCWLSTNKSVTLEFSAEIQIFFIYIYILHFTTFRPAVAQFFHADRKTHKHTWRSWQSIFPDIPIIGVFCLSVVTHTWHTGCSVHSILLQFPLHTALKATNPPGDHTLSARLKFYILCNFLFQDTSCVLLSISFYKQPFVTPLTG